MLVRHVEKSRVTEQAHQPHDLVNRHFFENMISLRETQHRRNQGLRQSAKLVALDPNDRANDLEELNRSDSSDTFLFNIGRIIIDHHLQ